ncbi:MAG: 4-(cytidine 5'-diphospho)-2-C-methyl-D-erythritol kinase [Candidatus Cryosericum sp.]
MSDWAERRTGVIEQHLDVETRIKVNAWLRVLPRRDGQELHELESLFLSVATGDRLHFDAVSSSHEEFHLTSNRPDLIPRNSVHQAWTAFISTIQSLPKGRTLQISACLEKRIPEKTGLGAGSGDAGAALFALNQLHGSPLSHDQLAALASSLGSDVPFFVRSGPCIVRGTGEVVDPIPPLPPLWCCIVLPPFRVDTKRAYAALDNAIATGRASEVEPTVALTSVIKALRTRISLAGSDEMRLNSFERTLGENAASFLSIRSLLLASDAIIAGLSGSGSAVFGIYAERAAASAAALDVQQRVRAARMLVAEIL